MLLRTIALFSLFAISLGFANLSMAEEVAPSADLAKAQNEALSDAVSGMLRKLDVNESQHFLVMYANYNIFSMVKAVRADVGAAVAGCVTHNKDMATALNERFSVWDEAIGETMKEAESNIENLSLAQVYMPQSEVKMIFGLVDEVRALNSSRFEKIPVTTPEACEFVLSKMDETEDSMNQMLKATLLSYPSMLHNKQQ